jgi:5'-nucleotidase
VPDREQSGIGAALTLHHPVYARPVPAGSYLGSGPLGTDPQGAGLQGAGLQGTGLHEIGAHPNPISAYIVEGTPGDSCILGLEQLIGKVDLVVSGINTGSNLGWDILVSGTVGAALQGYVRGYPTIAISVGSVQNPLFDVAADFLQLTAAQLDRAPTSDRFFLNVNVPSVSREQINGVQVTRLSGRSYSESVRSEGTGIQQRYWISRNRPVHHDNAEGTDAWALKNNRISITPLQLNLTNQEQIVDIEEFISAIPSRLLSKND